MITHTNKRYTTLLFDLDDTLLDFHHGETTSLHAVHTSHFANDIDIETFKTEYLTINRGLWKKVAEGSLTPQEVKHLRFKQLLQTLRLPHDPLHIATAYETQLGRAVAWFPHAKEVLTQLKKEYRIGIITNGLTDVQMAKYTHAGLASLCDCFIISEREGYSKPNPAIFQLAFDRLQTRAADSLMLGDSLDSDYQGALNTGMDFCWVNFRNHALGTYPAPLLQLQHFAQLPDLLLAQISPSQP